MTMWMKLTWLDLKLYLRNWIAVFFTLAFPILMLVLFGSMYGNDPSPMYGGYGSMDVTVPGYIAALIIGTTGMMSLPMELAARRQQGVLRRFRASPLPAWMVLGSQCLVNLVMALLGALLLVVGAVLAYKIHLPENLFQTLLGFVLGCIGIFSLGFLIASLARSVNVARAVTMALFYPMMFLSGGTIPLQFLPEGIQTAAKAMPLTYAVNLLHDLWFGQGWNITALLVLAGLSVVCIFIATKTFRWE